jgi:hypothetical protein
MGWCLGGYVWRGVEERLRDECEAVSRCVLIQVFETRTVKLKRSFFWRSQAHGVLHV